MASLIGTLGMSTTKRTAFTPISGQILYDITLNQWYLGDGSTAGGNPASASYVYTAANQGPNVNLGYSGNSFGSNSSVYSNTIMGGLSGFPNLQIYLSGAVNAYSTIGGYDNKLTGGTAQLFGWHNRWNTATSPSDTAYIGAIGSGTISVSSGTVTGSGTTFVSGSVPLRIGGILIANNTGGTVQSVSGGQSGVTNGTVLHITAIASDTSLTVAETSASFSGATWYTGNWQVVNDSYSATTTSNNSVCFGAYNGEYNGNGWNFFAGGRQNVIGWDGVNQTSSQCNTIGGDGNLTTGNDSAVFGLRNINIGSYADVWGSNNVVCGNGNSVHGASNLVGSSSFTCNYGLYAGGNNTISASSAGAADYCIVIGHSNVSNGKYSIVLGSACQSVSQLGMATGNLAYARNWGQFARASGDFAVIGDAQFSELTARCQTTNATSANLGLQGGTTASDRLTLRTGSSTSHIVAFIITIVATKTGGSTQHAIWTWRGTASIQNNAASMAIDNLRLDGTSGTISGGTATAANYAVGSPAWTTAISADTTNGAIQMSVVGASTTTINWVAKIELIEVLG